jgi:pentatricopeptide repeat protein
MKHGGEDHMTATDQSDVVDMDVASSSSSVDDTDDDDVSADHAAATQRVVTEEDTSSSVNEKTALLQSDGMITSSITPPSSIQEHVPLPDNSPKLSLHPASPLPLHINASPKSRHKRRPRPKRVDDGTITVECNDDVGATVNQRLVEYFCIVTSVPQQQERSQPHLQQRPTDESVRNISTDSSTSRITEPHQRGLEDISFNCSRRAVTETQCGNIHMPQQHYRNNNVLSSPHQTFVPTITARYPETDYVDNPFNPMILHFCFPAVGVGGDVTVHGTTEYMLPRVHHFVLTLGCGHKMYGTCLTVLEEYEEEVRSCRPDVVTKAIDIRQSPTTESNTKKDSRRTPSSKAIYVPKVLCLLSTWPYLTAFREYLSQLYRLAVMTNCMTEPLERYIINLCCEIPAPPPGAYEIQVPILDSIIRFWAPPAKLPIAYTALPYNVLFECLDVDHILLVWTALLVERKVLLVSRQYSVLTVCAEILCSLLFPLRWSHLYVPMLPRMLCPMLDAPVPYLCGIVRENWAYAQQFVGQGSETTYVVDLDRNSIEMLGGCQDPLPPIPPRKGNKLSATLLRSAGDVFWRTRGMEEAYTQEMMKKPSKRSWDTLRLAVSTSVCPQWEEKLSTLDYAFNLAYTPESPNLLDAATTSHDEQSQWDRVQECFLRFFVALLKDYRNYLLIPEKANNEPSKTPSFDQVAFMANLRADNVALMSQFCQTQHYHDFLSRRMYSPGEPDLVFFDQSIDAKLNRSKMKLKKVETPFLHSAKVHKDLTKLPAVSPSKEGLSFRRDDCRNVPYIYTKIPETLDQSLFYTPRPIPKMISAEFDRQAILVSRLRANIVSTDVDDDDSMDFFNDSNNGNGDDELLKFYKGDFDPSPEVASFTVYLYVYSSMVGRDWQKYSRKRRAEEATKPTTISDPLKSPNSTSDQNRDSSNTLNETLQDKDEIDPIIEDSSIYGTCCGGECAESGAMMISTTMSYVGAGVEDFYSTFFRKPWDEVCTSLSFHEDKNAMSIPEADDAAAEYEEAREVATAQLEVAFETLATMSLRGLSVDSDAYFSLMEACGRCGDTKRALKLIELMKKDGFVADSEVLSCFIAAFAHKEICGHERTMNADKGVDAYSRYLKKGLETAKHEKHSSTSQGLKSMNRNTLLLPSSPASPIPMIDDVSDEASDWSSTKSSAKSSLESTAVNEWMPIQLRKKAKRKRKQRRRGGSSKIETTRPVTEMIARHLGLGENLLEFVYPNLVIDTNSDTCPHCSNRLTESNIVDGWKPCSFKDYTTSCPKCQHRFVPRFVVMCNSPNFVGSQGIQTPLYCEFLSPWVLRKEFHHILKDHHQDPESGIDKILNPAWRNGTDIRATLFWNLVVCCRRYRLPFTFLLQGNFQNRLILPRKPDEI